MRAGSFYEWEVGAGNTTDRVNVVDGRLIVEGFTLKILDAGGTPSASDQLPVFTYGTLDSKTLSLGSVVFDTSALGLGWTYDSLSLVDNGTGTIYLTGLAKSTSTSGDTNGDGLVDATDYIAVKTHLGQSTGATLADGDFDEDGDVDWTDLQTLLSGINAGGGAAGGAVPEPASLFLLTGAGLGALLKRRRSRVA